MIGGFRERLRRRFVGRLGLVLPLFVMLPLVTGAYTYEALLGAENGATVQKAAVLVAMALVGVAIGFRVPPWPVLLILGAVGLGYLVGAVGNVWGEGLFDPSMARGALGYVLPWLAFFVDWRTISLRSRAWGVALLAPSAVVAGGLLHLAGVGVFIRHEYTGALRLAAAMPPAHLAALAIFSAAGAVWLWLLGRRVGLWLAFFAAGVCGLTGTRGATIATAIIFLGMIVVGICYKLPHWKLGAVVAVVGAIGAGVFVLPTFITRSTQQPEHGSPLSGRDAAWSYFLQRLNERPWTGFGPGGAPLLSAEAGNRTIRNSFVSPHSAYISLLVDLGWPLFIIVASGILAIIVATIRGTSGATRWLVVLIGAASVFYGAFDNLLNAPQSGVPFAMVLALMLSAEPRRSSQVSAGARSGISKRRRTRPNALKEAR